MTLPCILPFLLGSPGSAPWRALQIPSLHCIEMKGGGQGEMGGTHGLWAFLIYFFKVKECGNFIHFPHNSMIEVLLIFSLYLKYFQLLGGNIYPHTSQGNNVSPHSPIISVKHYLFRACLVSFMFLSPCLSPTPTPLAYSEANPRNCISSYPKYT